MDIVDIFLHLDKHLDAVVQSSGYWIYLILFLIIFCETGLVVTPFLPGDSLLFAAGAIAALGSYNVHLTVVLLIIAAVLGDAVNYWVGNWIGPKVFEKKDSRIFKQEYLLRTQKFYEKYGGKAIILARFVPIVRTFAPFLAGVGTMSYPRFAMYNITGAILWITSLTYAGYFFGGVPVIKNNFSIVVLVIIFLSILPAIIEIWRVRQEEKQLTRA